MGFFKDLIGGNRDSNSSRHIRRQVAESRDFTKAQLERARGDLFRLMDSQDVERRRGANAVLGNKQQYGPAAMDLLQQGHQGSQAQLLAGLGQQQNALMGMPTDVNAIPTTSFNPDMSFLQNAQIPEHVPQSPQPTQEDVIARLLAGIGGRR
jgi:hypothetical protein